jgi:hypothetical protein
MEEVKMHQKSLTRLFFVILAVFVFGVELFSSPQSAFASDGSSSKIVPSPKSDKVINWNRPVHLSTTKSNGVTPKVFPLPTSACYQDTAYVVSYKGVSTWYDTNISSSIPGATFEVNYLWCPRWSGDSVGLNVSSAMAEVNPSSSAHILVEFGSGWSYTWDGASMHSSTGLYYNDNQGYTFQRLNHNLGETYDVVQDNSVWGPGNLAWSVQFWARITDLSNGRVYTAKAISPTF